MSLHPPLQWTQRPDVVLVTIPLQDAKEVKILFGGDSLTVSCKVRDNHYEASVSLFAEIVPEECHKVVRPRQIEIKLQKKVHDETWLRLTKERARNPHIQVDWTRYKDENETPGDGSAENSDVGDFAMGADDSDLPDIPPATSVPEAMLAEMSKLRGDDSGGSASQGKETAPKGQKPHEDSDDDDDMPPPLEPA